MRNVPHRGTVKTFSRTHRPWASNQQENNRFTTTCSVDTCVVRQGPPAFCARSENAGLWSLAVTSSTFCLVGDFHALWNLPEFQHILLDMRITQGRAAALCVWVRFCRPLTQASRRPAGPFTCQVRVLRGHCAD